MNVELLEIGKVLLATLLGGVIGLERELQQKPAGFRTNMLIAAGSALLILISEKVTMEFLQTYDTQAISADPLLIIRSIVVGVSFLGAGSIVQTSSESGNKKSNVKNLATGASILISSIIGISVALEEYVLATMVAVLAVVINFTVGYIEDQWIHNNKNQ